MKPEKFPLTGECRCGQVKIELSAPPVMTAACHCRGCQKMASSAFSLTAMFPAGALRVVKGETVIGGDHGAQLHHQFCPRCMTWMFTRIEGIDAIVNVRPTMFDDTSWFSPFIETVTDEKLDWVHLPTRYSYAGFPPQEDFEALMAEFRDNG